MKPRVLILKAAGTNNDIETAEAFKFAGAVPEILHINRLLKDRKILNRYRILVIPGGFSYGDDISAGKVLANKLIYNLKDKLLEFVKDGRIVIGICNGFQVLVKSGLLPFSGEKQSVTLAYNDSGKFECRWVHLKVKGERLKVKGMWTKNLPEIIELPVAHAEGKFIAKDKETILRMKKNEQILFQYCDEKGEINCPYPENPNGSVESIAGIINETGNVLGLMPHPERFISTYQHPLWTRNKKVEPYGLVIFKNVVEYASRELKS